MYPSLINKKIPLNDLVCGEYYPPSQSFVYGNITMPTNVGALSYELKEGLTNFFNNHDFGLFTCFSYTTAVMKVNNDYWIFDSHARDAQGMINEKGKAVLIQFVSVDEIVQYLRDLYGVNKQYEVYVVTGKIVKSVSVIEHKHCQNLQEILNQIHKVIVFSLYSTLYKQYHFHLEVLVVCIFL